MIHETWKTIEGYRGIYEISDRGNVRSNFRANPIILSQKTDKDGYKLVCLHLDGVAKMHRVHRLVASAFIPNPQNLPLINHIDEKKCNNSVNNLEWCSASYNSNYGFCKQKNRLSHLGKTQSEETIAKRVAKTRTPIVQKTMDGGIVNHWDGIRFCASSLGFDSSSISKCCKGKMPHYKGFVWEYVNKVVIS